MDYTKLGEGSLKKRQLGRSDLFLSPVGLGTVKFGRNVQTKNREGDGKPLPDLNALRDLLSLAVDLGINVLDTAPAYGIAEEQIGRILGPFRNKFHIFSKVGEEFADLASHYVYSKSHVEQSVMRSLVRMRLSFLDGVFLHCHRNDLEIISNSQALEALMMLKEKGYIRQVGVSAMSLEGGLRALDCSDMVMVSYNAAYRAELPVIQYGADLGKGVFIKKALLQGYGDKSQIESSLRHVLETRGVTCAILGTTSKQHLMELAQVATN